MERKLKMEKTTAEMIIEEKPYGRVLTTYQIILNYLPSLTPSERKQLELKLSTMKNDE